MLLATVCGESEAKEGQDFFPLTVEYREKTYAAGRFPGGYFKRETRPQEHETLISRIIDRPIRPLFPEGFFAEVQVFVTVLSADPDIAVEGHAVTAASAAIHTSDIPFHGPIAAAVVGRVDGQFVADPGPSLLAKSDIELTVAGSLTHIVMIEGVCEEYSKQDILDAIAFGHKSIKEKIKLQEAMARKSIAQSAISSFACLIGTEKRSLRFCYRQDGCGKQHKRQAEQTERNRCSHQRYQSSFRSKASRRRKRRKEHSQFTQRNQRTSVFSPDGSRSRRHFQKRNPLRWPQAR